MTYGEKYVFSNCMGFYQGYLHSNNELDYAKPIKRGEA